MSSRVLILAVRNMATISGEWRLISERARALWLESGISTVVYTLTRRERLSSPSIAPRVEGIEIHHFVYGSLLEIPIAFTKMVREVMKVASHQSIKAVIISGALAYLSWPILRRTGKIIITDIHGPIEEWLEYPPKFIKWRLLVCFLVRLVKILERNVVSKCNATLVVSHPLEAYVKREYNSKQVFVIPCGAVSHMTIEDFVSARIEWRKKFGIGDSPAFVYSGGLSKWQLVDKVCFLFNTLKKHIPNCKLLLITPDPKVAMDIASGSGLMQEDVICISLPADEVGLALCACDVGFLLREDNITNKMAFPNKFAEYVRSGLIIITSPGLVEPYEIVTQYKLGIGIVPENMIQPSVIIDLKQMTDKRKTDIISYYRRCLEIFKRHMDMRVQIRPFINFLMDSKNIAFKSESSII